MHSPQDRRTRNLHPELDAHVNPSPREAQVLELVARGLSAKEAAHKLGIAPRTVERHIENIRNKLGARNKPHLVRKAIAMGELALGEVDSTAGD